MIHFTCDRCGAFVRRKDARIGKVENFLKGNLRFDLRPECFDELRCFLASRPAKEESRDPQTKGARRRRLRIPSAALHERQKDESA